MLSVAYGSGILFQPYSLVVSSHYEVSELLILFQNPLLLRYQHIVYWLDLVIRLRVRRGIILELVVSEDYEVDIEGQVKVIPQYFEQELIVFSCCLGIGVLFDFHESGVFTNWGVGPPIYL
ncbi:MAG: hypothetical protein EZS28_024331 [Streblomastix strix]|uniref:Uncharacterized protein n=1 Tax=Streblomastix strix TaxID=222440 RepID=A0A5J4VCR0_9EUKA|nr:MAG: hypothetical protein EZS28_024331 [Streblomastix strix]